MNPKISLVFVSFNYDLVKRAHLEKLLIGLNFLVDFLIVVDTSLHESAGLGAGNNVLFEFSGYQRGLELLKEEFEEDEISNVQVLFANDTILESHFRGLIISLLNNFVNVASMPYSEALLIGATQIAPPALVPIVKIGRYCPTFCFSIVGKCDFVLSTNLYDRLLEDKYFLEERIKELPLCFHNYMELWLSPVHWMRGWYRSIPGVKIGADVFNRKKTAIYLEMQMPKYLIEHGYALADVSLYCKKISVLMFVDRIYLFLLKSVHRLKYVFNHKLPLR